MEVLDLMNTHDNWEEILTQPPYCISVRRDGDYILLKYNQLSSDFSLPIVRECRGSIFYKNEDGKYECVCCAFMKFGNVGESYVPEIDWNSAVVEEKVDGSLLKVFYHNNRWHVATNGTIDAYKAEVGETGWTFGRLFDTAIKNILVSDFFNGLDQHMTYMFELVSPRSKVTIYYPETKLYYLGCRDMTTMQECKVYYSVMREADILYPKVYPLHNLEDCLAYVKTMTKDEEGFVVKDKNFNRIKIKSPEYLMAFHMNNNGVVTTKRIVRMIQNNMIDDFMAYCPAYRDQAQAVIDHINFIADVFERDWQQISNVAKIGDKKEFSNLATKYKSKDYLFAKYDNPYMNAFDWIVSRFTKSIMRVLKEYENGH